MKNIVLNFFNDFSLITKRWNENIRTNLLFSEHRKFYKKYSQSGINIWSITEPIIKFLIFYELCVKYKIRLEDYAYGESGKLLDIALYIEHDSDDKSAEVGIELKWVSFTNEGVLNSNSVDKLIDDFVKIKDSDNQEKYIIQFGSHATTININIKSLEKQVKDTIDGRIFQKYFLKPIDIKSFPICIDDNEANDHFYLILWYLEPKGA